MAPFDEMAAIYAADPAWMNSRVMFYEGATRPIVRSQSMRDAELEHLRAVLDVLPSKAAFQDMKARVAPALATFDFNSTRLIVALMVDGFPNGRPHEPVVYVESLIQELKVSGFSPAVAAKACNDVLRGMRFLPAVAELVGLASSAREDVERFFRTIDRGLASRADHEQALAAVEGLTDLPTHAEYLAARQAAADEVARGQARVVPDRAIRAAAKSFAKEGYWPPGFGPKPGEADCIASDEILRECGLTPDQQEGDNHDQ